MISGNSSSNPAEWQGPCQVAGGYGGKKYIVLTTNIVLYGITIINHIIILRLYLPLSTILLPIINHIITNHDQAYHLVI
jgi:hypothetical protein